MVMILISSLAAGCSASSQVEGVTPLNYGAHQSIEREFNKKTTERDRKEFKGLVKEKRPFSSFHQILVHPGNSNGPTYFNVSKKTFEQIEVGNNVMVLEKQEGAVHFSAPPIRYAEEVKILSE